MSLHHIRRLGKAKFGWKATGVTCFPRKLPWGNAGRSNYKPEVAVAVCTSDRFDGRLLLGSGNSMTFLASVPDLREAVGGEDVVGKFLNLKLTEPSPTNSPKTKNKSNSTHTWRETWPGERDNHTMCILPL